MGVMLCGFFGFLRQADDCIDIFYWFVAMGGMGGLLDAEDGVLRGWRHLRDICNEF